MTINSLDENQENKILLQSSVLSTETGMRTVFNAITEGIAVVDLSGCFVDVNSGLVKILGYHNPSELIGKPAVNVVLPSDRLLIKREFKYSRDNRVENIIECTLVKSDGSTLLSEIKSSVLMNPQGDINGFVIVVHEITGRKINEEDTLIAKGNFLKLLNESPFGIVIVNKKEEMLYANRAAIDMFGYDSEEEFSKTRPEDVLTRESLIEFQSKKKDSSMGLKNLSNTSNISIRTKNQGIKHLLAFRRSVIWEEEVCTQYLYYDVTEAREAEELHRILADNSPVGVYVLQDDRICYANSKFRKTSGYTMEELSTMSTLQLVHPDDRDYVKQSARKMLSDDNILSYEFRFINKSGEIRWAIESVSSIHYNGKPAVVGNLTDITEQIKAVDELSYSDAALRSIHEGVYSMNNDFVVTRWNNICEQLFETPESEAVGKHIWEILEMVEEYPEQNNKRLEKLFRNGFNREEQLYKLKRGKIWLDVSAQAIEINGERKGWITILSDISERKRMERELKQSEEHTRSLINAMEDILFTYDLEGRFTDFYKIPEQIIRYVEDNELKFVDKKYSEVLDADISKKMDIAFEQLLKTGENQQFDYRMDVHGRVHWYDARVSPIRSEKDTISGVLVVSRDISERKKMEEVIAEAAREWEATFNSLSEEVYITDRDYRIVRANKGYANAIGMSPEDVTGKYCYQLVHKRNTPCSECNVQEVLRTNKQVTRNIFLRSRDKYFQGVTSPIFDSEGKITSFITSTRDISEAKKIESQLQQSQLLASLGTMVAGIAHEVNNPLGSVLLLSELLLKDNSSEKIKKDLRVIHSEAKRAAKIMSTLLTYRKRTMINNRRLNLNRIITKVMKIRQYRLNVLNIGMTASLPENPVYIRGDFTQLTQVFMNIMINAEEALKNSDKGNIHIHVETDKNWARVKFIDNGCGIPEENLDNIFHPFFTTKNVGEGTGLGLSTCYSVITSHNGLIHAENNELGGATMVIEIPVMEEKKKRLQKIGKKAAGE